MTLVGVTKPETRPAREPIVHLTALNGLRALAALYVVTHHMFLEIWPEDKIVTRAAPASIHVFFGHAAVALFMVLSGFCLMIPSIDSKNSGACEGWCVRGDVATFFRRRMRRILPPYYFALLLSLALISLLIGKRTGTHWDVSIPVTAYGLLSHLFMVQNLVGSDEINHVFWSIALEWQCYLLFPIILLGWRRFGGRLTTAIVFTIAFLLAVTLSRAKIDSIRCIHLFGLFAVGMGTAVVALGNAPKYQRIRLSCPWLIVLGVATIAAVPVMSHLHTWAADIIIGTLAAILLIVLTMPEATAGMRITRGLFGIRPFASLGAVSYSVYLIHGPLIQIVWQYIVTPMGRSLSETSTFLLLVLVGVPITVAASCLFFWVFERPFLNSRVRTATAMPFAGSESIINRK